MSTYDPVGPGHNPARRKALSCLAAWTGAAVVWTVAGGVPRALGATSAGTPTAAGEEVTPSSTAGRSRRCRWLIPLILPRATKEEPGANNLHTMKGGG